MLLLRKTPVPLCCTAAALLLHCLGWSSALSQSQEYFWVGRLRCRLPLPSLISPRSTALMQQQRKRPKQRSSSTSNPAALQERLLLQCWSQRMLTQSVQYQPMQSISFDKQKKLTKRNQTTLKNCGFTYFFAKLTGISSPAIACLHTYRSLITAHCTTHFLGDY